MLPPVQHASTLAKTEVFRERPDHGHVVDLPQLTRHPHHVAGLLEGQEKRNVV